MTNLRKAAEMALEALEDVFDLENKDVAAIDALRKALSQEWVGLTNEEIDDLWKKEYFNIHYELPKAIEAKLKEKNGEG